MEMCVCVVAIVTLSGYKEWLQWDWEAERLVLLEITKWKWDSVIKQLRWSMHLATLKI